MRIRKRFPPPSDPQLNTKNESLPSDLPNLSLPQPSDQPATVIGAKTTTSWVLFGGNNNNPPKIEKKVSLNLIIINILFVCIHDTTTITIIYSV